MSKSTLSQRFIAQYFAMLREYCSTEYGRCNILVKGSAVKSPVMKAAVKDEVIVLNIGYNAVREYGADDTQFWFKGRCGGVEFVEVIAYDDVFGFMMKFIEEHEYWMWVDLSTFCIANPKDRDNAVGLTLITLRDNGVGDSPDEQKPTAPKKWTPQVISGGKEVDQSTSATVAPFVTGLSVVKPTVE